MKINQFITLVLCLSGTLVFAQRGGVAGKIQDLNNGESAFNAAVRIAEIGKGTYTDFDGYYSLQGIDAGTYTLEIQLLGYQKTSISGVQIEAGKTTTIDVALKPASEELGEITVTAEAIRNSVAAIQLTQKNSSVVLEGVSSEQIRRMPDNNSADILKRTSGTTVESGKYIIVRGLNDRYNLAMVNGAIMPASEPDRKVFSFDLYPTTMIENMFIFKTAQADLPAEFAGGLVQIETKNFPTEDYIRVAASTGMNMGVSLNTVDHYQGFSSDQWGMVAPERELPSLSNALRSRGPAAITPSEKFNNYWTPEQMTALPYLRMNLSGGLKRDFGKSSFGANVALNYSNKTTGRSIRSTNIDVPNGPVGEPGFFSQFNENIEREEVNKSRNWGALVNLSYKRGANQITMNNSYSVVSNDLFYIADGKEPNDDLATTNEEFRIRRYEFNYSTNQLRVHQLLGKHKIRMNESADIELDWGGSISNIVNESPDLKRMRYFWNPQISADPRYQWATPPTVKLEDGGRFWSALEEDNNSYFGNAKFNYTLFGRKQSLKTGAYYQDRSRSFDAHVLGYTPSGPQFDADISILPIDEIFATQNMRFPDGIQIYDITSAADAYAGTAQNMAIYGMVDLNITDWWRMTAGVRQENFTQRFQSGYSTQRPGGGTLDNEYKYANLLPSTNMIFKLNEKMNIRASYSKAVSRPEFREIAPFTFFDFDFFMDKIGNPDLTQAEIQNFDLRYEAYYTRGQMFAISAYYKKFNGPIELALRQSSDNFFITWQNSNEANNYGIELSWRNDFSFVGEGWNNLIFFGNYSYIQSSIEQQDRNGAPYTRPMIGQSPYILNLGLDYHVDKWNADFVLLYNKFGRRIVITGNRELNLEPIWENPRPLLDFRYRQAISENLSITITFKDLINKAIIYYQDNNLNDDWDDIELISSDQIPSNIDHVRTLIQPNREISIGLTWKL
ncbi:MAG: TonB-dependent receptor [Flavobacteriia bacterium]|nr:TonB-dependent receptor [Flavobacteriia bacterium]